MRRNKMSEATKKTNRKKSFADKITAVKESAPLAEKKKPAPKEKKSIGQPKKEEKIKQNIPIVIYVNEQQKEQVEKNSINAGYSAKDRAKWLKSIAISDYDTNQDATSNDAQLQAKDDKIAMLEKLLKEKERTLKMLETMLNKK